MKKRWEKPKLVVMSKGNPEERVLAVCKGDWRAPNGADRHDSGCLLHGCPKACSYPNVS